MKIKFTILIGLIWMGSQSFAQVNPFRFGVKVAPNISWMSPDSKGYESDGSVFGFSWGFLADIALTENYFVKTGFNLDYQNAKLKFPHQIKLDENASEFTVGTVQRKYNLRYLELPLTIKMRTNQFDQKAFYGEVGFGTAFNLKAGAKDDFSYNDGNNSLQLESDINDEVAFIKSSLLVGAGMEYFIDESTSLILSLNFSNGLNNILTKENSVDPGISQKAHLYSFQLNIGVMF